MHILLTDRLVCPRCGPPYGLILLADRMVDRRVLEGRLGCPNCRDRFPVTGGFGDLRAPPRPPLDGASAFGDAASATSAEREAAASRDEDEDSEDAVAEAADPEEALRLGALLGVVRGPGHLALVGPHARHAPLLAERLDQIEVVAIAEEGAGAEEREGVSRIVARPGLPFFGGTLRGVALHGERDDGRLEEAARVVAPGGRVVVTDADGGIVDRMEGAGLTVLVDEAGVVVGER